MSEKLRLFIVNFKWSAAVLCCTLLTENMTHRVVLAVIAIVLAAFNVLEFCLTKTYISIGQLHPNSTKEEEQEAIANSMEDKFINEVLGYASTLQLNVTLDFSNGAMSIIDFDSNTNTQIPICELVFPDHNAKYGSDKYKSAIAMMKEQLDQYAVEKEKTVNKAVEEEAKKNDQN